MCPGLSRAVQGCFEVDTNILKIEVHNIRSARRAPANMHSHPRYREGKTDWKLESLRNISRWVPIGMCISVHLFSRTRMVIFKPLPLNPPLPLLRWSNERPQIWRSPRLSWPWNYNCSRMPKYFAKKQWMYRFVVIKQCFRRTHALNINEKLTRMLTFSYIGTNPWCR